MTRIITKYIFASYCQAPQPPSKEMFQLAPVTLVEDSNAEKGKIKNWMMVLFLRKVSDADDMTFLYIL